MTIVMCTNDFVSATKIRIAMKSSSININIYDEKSLQAQFQNIIPKYSRSILILDRIIPKKTFWVECSPDMQVFAIIKQWKDLKYYEELSDSRICRFYLWPLNLHMLIDDIRAVLFTEPYLPKGKVEFGKLLIDLNAHTLSDGKQTVFLRRREYDLLLCLMKNKGRVLSRNTLLEMVWDINSQVTTNTVDVHISRLRKILAYRFGLKAVIKTIPSSGYIVP